MKNTGALLLIIGGLFGLWLYNTGRLQAVANVVKDPNYQPQQAPRPGTVGQVTPGTGGGNDFLGGIEDIFASAGQAFDTLGDIGNIFLAPLGIRL